MKKIPNIFMKNPENMGLVLNEINPICQWVFDGEGVARQKYDGTSCMMLNREFFKRRMVKKGKKNPNGFVLADYDENTGKSFGWVLVYRDNSSDKYHIKALDRLGTTPPAGTYELVGPKVQSGAEGFDKHVLLPHNGAKIFKVTRSFEKIKDFLKYQDIEGLVFHHEDGRMGKIRKSDFGMKRKEV